MKKGFTLVELLAVIIIIGIIALITVPIVLSVIGSSKQKALQNSAYGLIESGKIYYSNSLSKKSFCSLIFYFFLFSVIICFNISI